MVGTTLEDLGLGGSALAGTRRLMVGTTLEDLGLGGSALAGTRRLILIVRHDWLSLGRTHAAMRSVGPTGTRDDPVRFPPPRPGSPASLAGRGSAVPPAVAAPRSEAA